MPNPDETNVLKRLETSRAQRILWLFEELKVPYQLKTYKRTKERFAPAELKEVHPLGKSPVVTIEVPGREPLVLAESASIVEYLCELSFFRFLSSRFGKSAVKIRKVDDAQVTTMELVLYRSDTRRAKKARLGERPNPGCDIDILCITPKARFFH